MTSPTTVQVRLQIRADTAANWTASNPVLLANELGRETDTGKFKVGNGSTAWNSLSYQPWGGLISNADIAANAEIDVSKLADGTARQLLQTDAAGTGVEWASNIDIPGTLDVTGAATFDSAVIVQGNLTVNGTTTTIDTQNLIVEDKNVVIGQVTSPTDATADGGGITLKGTTDKTINWVDATDAWTFSEHINIASGKSYYINGTQVLSSSALGSGITSSNLTSVGTISSGTWQGTAIVDTYLATISTAGKVSGTALTGTIPSSVLGNSTVYLGTTAVALNRASSNQSITGISSIAMPGATSGTITVTPAATAGTTDITVPATTGTLITSGDTGTVTSTMLADDTIVNADINTSAAIAFSKLASLTAGQILLGNSSNVPTGTALSGDVSITSSGVTTVISGTTSTAGKLQLTDSTSSTSTTTAATPNSVKSAFDLANAALPKSGGTMTGSITFASGQTISGYGALDTAQTWTRGQRGEVTTLTDGATITPDFSDSNNFKVTLGGNRTLANPTNLTEGQSGVIVVTQDGTGSRTLTYGSNWKFASGVAPTLSTAANAVDVLSYYVASSTQIITSLLNDLK